MQRTFPAALAFAAVGYSALENGGFYATSWAWPTIAFLLTIAIVALVLFKIAFQYSHLFDEGAALSSVSEPVGLFLFTCLRVNVSLAVFNLVPIPPLDGSKVLWTILPDSMKPALEALERFGFIILLLMVSSGVLNTLFAPVMRLVLYLLEL